MLIAAGDRYDRLVSWGAVSTSDDAQTWTVPTEPFPFRAKIIGVTHGADDVIVVSDAGWVARSGPAVDAWEWDRIWDGTFSPQGIDYATDLQGENGMYMMAGQVKFAEAQGTFAVQDETACIFSNLTGKNDDWAMAYVHEEVDSRFYNVKRISNTKVDAWFAIGSVANRPLIIYSLDNGVTWETVQLPNLSNVRYAYDVTFNDDRFWFTTNGFIFSTPSITDPVWDASPEIKPKYGAADLRRIAVNPAGQMAAVCSGGIFYTLDCASWNMFSPPGYRFRSIAWYGDRWVAGAESTLTTYTYWTSTDTINWTPANNMVQIYDFVEV